MINLPMMSLERFLLIRGERMQKRANAPQSSTHDDKQTADKQTKEKAACSIKPKHQSIKVNSIAAQAYSVSYPRNDRDAHAEALDEHERLIKQGWEFLRNQMKGNSWVYVKTLHLAREINLNLVILLSKMACHWFVSVLLRPAANRKGNRDDRLIDSM